MRVVWLAVATVVLLAPACSEEPARKTSATVTAISARDETRWHSNQVLVTATSKDGLVGTMIMSAADLHCHIGDVVPAIVSGIKLTIAERACRR